MRHLRSIAIIGILSIVLFANLFPGYNKWFIGASLLLFISQVVYYFKQSIGIGYFSFSTLFFLMFGLVTYTVPMFYLLGIEDQIFTFVIIKDQYINQSLLLSSIAIESYIWGAMSIQAKNETYIGLEDDHSSSFPNILRINKVLCFFAFVFFCYEFYKSYSQSLMDVDGITVTFSSCIICYALAFCGYTNQFNNLRLFPFIKKHAFVLSVALLVVFMMLAIGDRMLPLFIGCAFLFVIDRFVHKIKGVEALTLIVVSVLMLFLVSYTRHDDKSILKGLTEFSNSDTKSDFFQDIFPVNLDLYLAMEWKDSHGFYAPGRIFVYALSPIPYVPSMIKKEFYGGTVATGDLLTHYNQSINNITTESGVGTHVVGDIFLSWGLIGVILLFYLLGKLVRSSSKNFYDFYNLLIYTGFVSTAVYMPRESVFVPYRNIIWMVVIAYMITGLKRIRQ